MAMAAHPKLPLLYVWQDMVVPEPAKPLSKTETVAAEEKLLTAGGRSAQIGLGRPSHRAHPLVERFGVLLDATREAAGIRERGEDSDEPQPGVETTGRAGGLYVHMLGSITTEQVYLELTFVTLAMLVVGGVTSLWGAVVGALGTLVVLALLHPAVLLLVLAVLLVALSFAWASHLAGLSLALGGFLAGMMLADDAKRLGQLLVHALPSFVTYLRVALRLEPLDARRHVQPEQVPVQPDGRRVGRAVADPHADEPRTA